MLQGLPDALSLPEEQADVLDALPLEPAFSSFTGSTSGAYPEYRVPLGHDTSLELLSVKTLQIHLALAFFNLRHSFPRQKGSVNQQTIIKARSAHYSEVCMPYAVSVMQRLLLNQVDQCSWEPAYYA